VTSVEQVRERLGEIRPMGLNRDIVSAGMVRDVRLDGNTVHIRLLRGPLPKSVLDVTLTDIRRAVGAFDGVDQVQVDVEQPQAPGAGEMGAVPGVEAIVAVSSTKGGVGKSTVAVNLACALGQQGMRIGLLDADVYGPSLPTMLGLSGRPQVVDGNQVLPLSAFGISAMSMGFFLDDSSPVIWRGPLVTGLLRQFLKDVRWGELDVLVVDMPPGTGDAQLTLVQQVPLSGAIVVTTPQEVSLVDVERGISMFRQVNTPVFGIVENMSDFACPSCGAHEPIFGSGGGESLARECGVPLLVQIPLVESIRRHGDDGRPMVVAEPGHPVAAVYRDLAEKVRGALKQGAEQAPAPRIVG
jgi:ATP-binding protein involved in chromosome partitioning